MEQKIDDDELYSTYRKEIKSIPLPPLCIERSNITTKYQKNSSSRRQKSYDWVNTEILLRERLIGQCKLLRV